MKIIDCIQGEPEWFEAKLGIPSASNFSKIVTCKGDRSKMATKYLYQLAGEKVAGQAEEGYENAAMRRGKELEPEARELYELVTGETVDQVGFCMREDVLCGASPDGCIGKDGLVEIKCPTMAVHVGYLVGGTLPKDYLQQVQGQLYVTGRKWVDFVSYYPGIKPFIIRVRRDEAFLVALDSVLKGIVKELGAVVKQISEGL